MVTILIPELIPAHNKGEEAIFWGILETLKFIPDKKVYLYSKHPEYDAKTFGDSAELVTKSLIPEHYDSRNKKIQRLLEQVPRHAFYALLYRISPKLARMFFKGDLWKAYDEMDFVIAGHDSGYTTTHNLLILFVRALGKPMIIYGASITPSFHRKPWVRHLTRIALNRADLVTTREEISRDIVVDKIGVNPAHVHLCGDKAFLVKPCDKERALSIYAKYGIVPGKQPLIGMTVVYKTGMAIMSSQKFDMDSAQSQQFDSDRHLDIMAEVVDYIVEQTNGHIVFFPHCIGPTEAHDDRTGAALVYERSRHKDSLHLINDDYCVSDLKGMIGQCDFFLGERTHSVIGAASMCIPCAVISQPDDYRTVGILGKMAGMSDWIYNVKELKAETLKEFFSNAWSAREAIREHLTRQIPKVVEMSLSNGRYLEEVLREKGVI